MHFWHANARNLPFCSGVGALALAAVIPSEFSVEDVRIAMVAHLALALLVAGQLVSAIAHRPRRCPACATTPVDAVLELRRRRWQTAIAHAPSSSCLVFLLVVLSPFAISWAVLQATDLVTAWRVFLVVLGLIQLVLAPAEFHHNRLRPWCTCKPLPPPPPIRWRTGTG